MRCLGSKYRLFESIACSAAGFFATCDLCLSRHLPQPGYWFVMRSQNVQLSP